MKYPIRITILIALLAGCGSEQPAEPPTPATDALDVAEATQPALTGPLPDEPAENLFIDPGFQSMHGEAGDRKWWVRQHAGEQGFEIYFDDSGTVTMVSLDKQPWANVLQRVDVSQHCGKTLRVLADVKLDLTDPASVYIFNTGGGLILVAYNTERRFLGSALMDHEPREGSHPWRRLASDYLLPEDCSYVEAGVTLRSSGSLQARNLTLGVMP